MDELKDKAVDIKGKKYVLVSDRVLYFNENFPKGAIHTVLLSKPEDSRVVMRAEVYPEGYGGVRKFVGHSQAVVGEGMVNKTAALENAETSAVGRALAMMGIGVIESIASADEMAKAQPKSVVEAKGEPFPTEHTSHRHIENPDLSEVKWD